MQSIENKEVFAQNLSYYIERSGKSQRDIATKLGLATSTLNNWVTAKKYPRIDKIELLATYFGIQKSDLIEDKTGGKIEESAFNDGLTEKQRILMDFARTVPDDKVSMILRVMQSILEETK